jgi:superfamily II DNA or RNA helicase
MIIAAYRNILQYIFDAITHKNMATVGFYVGGMKEAALKTTESKQIVLATFAMASEGLDIKSLSTLFMVTPMTKIEQSVGRILRQKHEFNPVVVDIIDTHPNFQRQWLKRKSFFKSQNYKIIQTTSSAYQPDCSKWKVTYEPTNQDLMPKKQKSENVSKTKTISSKSSSEDELSDFSEEENDEEEDKNVGKCLLKFKK